MSTISKKVLRRKIKLLKIKLGETLRKRLEERFVGMPIAGYEIGESRIDEEKGIQYIDVLVKPYVSCINVVITLKPDEVACVND